MAMYEKTGNRISEPSSVTDGAMRIVEEVSLRTHTTDRLRLLDAICEDLEARYVGEDFEYHISQMNLKTTADILRAIDIYFIMQEFYPETSFAKNAEAC